jgi:DNA-binding SARP family transcriptional activator
LIRLLGGFRVEFSEGAVDDSVWRRVHARRLLQLLGSSTRQSEARASVLEALWPDFDEARARNRLHHTIHWIRKSLEELPEALRPQIVVGRERVELLLPAHTCIDALEFERCLSQDDEDESVRLRTIELALHWYGGELAPDWLDNPEIAARRARLADMHAKALNQAVQLAWELDLPDRALEHAQRLSQLLEFDLDAQLTYATLLADQGRPDAALLHCKSARQALVEIDPGSAARLDQLERQIQQKVNRPGAVAAAPPATSSMGSADAVAARSRLPAPVSILGYEREREAALQGLRDPLVAIVTLAGPPGCGKSALAGWLAREVAAEHRHGVVWIDCAGMAAAPDALRERLLSGLADAGLAPSTPGDAAPLDLMARALKGRELLVVVDGLEDASLLGHEWARLTGLGSDVRWLVTAWTNLRALGERTIALDPSQLLQTDELGGPSPGCRLLLQSGHPVGSVDNPEDAKLAHALACELDGLPSLLKTANRWGSTGLLAELYGRVLQDPAAILRLDGEAGQPDELPLSSLVRWLWSADRGVRQLLGTLAQMRSWLTREDMACLFEELDETELHALIDLCVRRHLMLRRVRKGDHSTWSEFRVPRYVVAALAHGDGGAVHEDHQGRIERLFLHHGTAKGPGEGHDPAQRLAWFDDRFDDFEALVARLQQQLNFRAVASVCLAQAAFLRRPRHARKALEWLEWLGGGMDGLEAATAPLLVERSELRVQLGNFIGAFEDACRALGQGNRGSNPLLEARARRIVERYGNAQERPRWPRAMSQRGLEAGEALLRVAQLAARRGALGQALQLCAQSEGVFGYFGFKRGLLRAYQSQAKFAFRLGQTEAAHRNLAMARAAATSSCDLHEVARCDLMLAELLISEQHFSKALEACGQVLAELPGDAPPLLVRRGLLAMGWTHYALGALPVARALSREMEDPSSGPSDLATVFEAGMLASLLDARRGNAESARRRLRGTLELIGREHVFVDPQGELVNVADLAMLLKCPDVASSMLAELTRFEQVPGQELRPWVRARTLALGVTATQGPGTRALAESTGPTLVRDAIGSLASASAALPALERLE